MRLFLVVVVVVDLAALSPSTTPPAEAQTNKKNQHVKSVSLGGVNLITPSWEIYMKTLVKIIKQQQRPFKRELRLTD